MQERQLPLLQQRQSKLGANLCQLLFARHQVIGLNMNIGKREHQHKETLNDIIVCLPTLRHVPRLRRWAILGELTQLHDQHVMGDDAKQHATMLNIIALQKHTCA